MQQFRLEENSSKCRCGRLLVFVAAAVLLAAQMELSAQSPNVLQRVPDTTLKMPQTPQSFGYKTQPAFGAMAFSSPVAVRTPVGETNRVFVVEQGGRIYVITNLTAPTKTLFLDLSHQVLVGMLSGLF